jgi:selenium-binding protein 1
MTNLNFSHSHFLKSFAVFILAAFLCVGVVAARWTLTGASKAVKRLQEDEREKEKDKPKDRERVLFIWAGDQARTNPDFLAVVNFDEYSRDYGKIITTVPLPGPGATGNEPHHVGLSRDGRVLACGGLLSVLRAQKEVFFFDVSNPEAPRFISSADPPQSAITDEFYPLADGGFLVTMMGGAEGHAPGRVAEFTKDLRLVAEYPSAPPMNGFNPHGISVRPEMNLMVTSDFICPATTLHVMPGGLELRGSVRIWDF